MFRHIMVPVDLSHVAQLERALKTAADLAKQYGAPVTYVGITSNVPTSEAPSPADFAQKLEAFAAGEAERHGQAVTARTYESHDPTVEIDKLLVSAAQDIGADLIVMATHAPGIFEPLRSHHGAHLAGHTSASVFLVR